MEFKEIVKQRYNTKRFDGRKIDEPELGELFDVIRYAPSADNLQPWKVKVVSGRDILDKLVAVTLPFNQERVRTCSHLLVFCADRDLESRWPRLEAALRQAGYQDKEIEHMGNVARMIMSRAPEELLSRSQWDVFLPWGTRSTARRRWGSTHRSWAASTRRSTRGYWSCPRRWCPR